MHEWMYVHVCMYCSIGKICNFVSNSWFSGLDIFSPRLQIFASATRLLNVNCRAVRILFYWLVMQLPFQRRTITRFITDDEVACGLSILLLSCFQPCRELHWTAFLHNTSLTESFFIIIASFVRFISLYLILLNYLAHQRYVRCTLYKFTTY